MKLFKYQYTKVQMNSKNNSNSKSCTQVTKQLDYYSSVTSTSSTQVQGQKH